jgi:hypothetical protein
MSEHRTPLSPGVSTVELDLYAEMLGGEPKMLRRLGRCPVCGTYILACDNGWLNAAATDAKDPLVFGVMQFGPLLMMAAGDIDGGSRHLLHNHQPDPEQDLE